MSTLKREKPADEESWSKARRARGLGGSDAAAVVGMSPWKTANDLWLEKTGAKEPPDLSDNPLIEQGKRMESAVRELYKAANPEYKVKYNPYDLLYQEERSWLFATLDGEVTDDKGRHGILECKTSSPQSRAEWGLWDEQIPKQYHIQILHQMLATGWEFVDLMALLINKERDFVVRTYHFERSDYEEDLRWLAQKEETFWWSVIRKELPPMTLIL